MFRKIVVPLDLTDRHQQALDVAAELAAQSRGTICLLHVIETIAGVTMEEEKEFYDRLEQSARRHLEKWGAQLDTRKLTWQAEIRYGHPAAEGVRYAQASGADLIVLTAPSIDPAHPAIGWGSSSYKIGILSACPVLLVKRPPAS